MGILGNFDNPCGKNVLDAGAVNFFTGDADIAGKDAHSGAFPDGNVVVAQPQAAAGKIHAHQMPCVVAFANHGVNDHPGVFAQPDRQIKPRQGFTQGADGNGLAAFQDDDMVSESRHFIRGVTHIQDGHFQLIVQSRQIGQDFLFAVVIERGQRLVHEQNARIDGQRPRHADAAAFAAGEAVRLAVEQFADAQKLNGLIEAGLQVASGLRCDALHAVAQIGQDGKVREEAGLLKDVADRALVRGEPVLIVLPGFALDHEPADGGTFQTSDTAQDGGLARTGMAE